MDISYLGKEKFKIKAKTGTVTTDLAGLTIVHKTEGDDFVVSEPGEYEVEGISVFGYRVEESMAYVIQFDDIRVLYLGALTKPLSEKNVSELENIDAVIVSTEGMGSKEIVELVSKLEPYYVLPYGEGTAKFIASYDHGSRSVKSLNLSKVSLNEDLTEVIVFE